MHLHRRNPLQRALNAAMLVAMVIVFAARRLGCTDDEEEELFHD